MKNKVSSLVLLTLILSVAMVSALDFTLSTPDALTKSKSSTSFLVRNTNSLNSITVNIADITDIVDNNGHVIAITQSKTGSINLAAGASETVTVSYSDLPSKLDLGTFSSIIRVTQGNESLTSNLNFISSFCEEGEREDNSTSDIRTLEITSVKDDSSDDDWEWKPLDEVKINVKVKFTSDDDDDSVDGIIEVALYDTETDEFIDFENQDDLEIDFSLDEGDSTTETIIVQVPVEDLEESETRYKLYVKAYEDGDEETLCTDKIDGDYFQDIQIKKNSYDVSLTEIDISSPAPCNGEVTVTAEAYNLGTHDEDEVQVVLYNKELGIEVTSNRFSLDEGDSEKIEMTFKVPSNAQEKNYPISLRTEFRYSDSSEEFREQSDVYTANLQVEGDCSSVPGQANVQITAELDPETPDAIAGKQVIVSATIKNTGNAGEAFSISVSGNSAWSSLEAIDPQILTLNAGESQEVKIYLNIDNDAEGEKEFKIKVTSGTGASAEQSLALSIEKASGNQIIEHIKANWFIYLIILVNVILIIAIIAVISKMSRRRSMEEM